jgi:S-adenosyl-L-methionine hydrolase (adenosine-forming)
VTGALPITFLSDYGYDDDFVGVCHGVIQRIAPGAHVIDIAHGLPPQDIRAAALVLRNALEFMPEGVHLAVVDPGVGTERRAIALRCGSRLLVGPDNGLLWLAAEVSGGIEQAVDLRESPYRLEPVSPTFHGRDLFAPVAGRLALGDSLEDVGEPFPNTEVTRLELPRAVVRPGQLTTSMLHVDRFGNVQLSLNGEDMRAAGFAQGDLLEVEIERKRISCAYARTFGDADVGELIAYEDSSGMIALARNGRPAADTLGFAPDAPVTIVKSHAQ